MIKPDSWIKAQKDMIVPFSPELVKTEGMKKIISYGISSFGYDLRLADEYKVFTNTYADVIVDPKNFDSRAFVDVKGLGYCIIPPNSFALAKTMEYIKMPRNVTGLVTCKSSYARCGIISPSCVLEANWEGVVTIEISNTTPLPAKVYSFEGFVQVLFFEGEPCEISYADRDGKYQGQTGITLARV